MELTVAGSLPVAPQAPTSVPVPAPPLAPAAAAPGSQPTQMDPGWQPAALTAVAAGGQNPQWQPAAMNPQWQPAAMNPQWQPAPADARRSGQPQQRPWTRSGSPHRSTRRGQRTTATDWSSSATRAGGVAGSPAPPGWWTGSSP